MNKDIIDLLMKRLVVKPVNTSINIEDEVLDISSTIGFILNNEFKDMFNVSKKILALQLNKLTHLKNIETQYMNYDIVYPSY